MELLISSFFGMNLGRIWDGFGMQIFQVTANICMHKDFKNNIKLFIGGGEKNEFGVKKRKEQGFFFYGRFEKCS